MTAQKHIEKSTSDIVGRKDSAQVMTLREVADTLHVHPNTVRRWRAAGRLRAWHMGAHGHWRFYKENIDQILEKGGLRK